MSEDYEYCVLGGGNVGSAAAYLLARTGASVVLPEQYERGSSHGESRITRCSYDHPCYVRMTGERIRSGMRSCKSLKRCSF